MKRSPLFSNRGLVPNTFVNAVRLAAFAFVLSFTLTACSDDDSPNPYIGTYAVLETDEFDDEENYTIKLAKTSQGFEITNFGDIMNVPVKASINGKTLTIPDQTFVGKTITIVVSGQGSFNSDGMLTFTYAVATGDDIILEYSCVATKQ